MSLKRIDLENMSFQETIAKSGADLCILTDNELKISIQKILDMCSLPSEIWVFAYGSLIWNPIFQYNNFKVGIVNGWHRRFCLQMPVGRGTLENPGLGLGLDYGNFCQGVVFQIDMNDVFSELLLLWRREMVVGAYIPKLIQVICDDNVIEAITFTINHDHSLYVGNLSQDRIIYQIASASGTFGRCSDYLQQTIDGLKNYGIIDSYLNSLNNHVLKHMETL
jgi:glutathione-specific gamma-glutamylcyclotransferase